MAGAIFASALFASEEAAVFVEVAAASFAVLFLVLFDLLGATFWFEGEAVIALVFFFAGFAVFERCVLFKDCEVLLLVLAEPDSVAGRVPSCFDLVFVPF